MRLRSINCAPWLAALLPLLLAHCSPDVDNTLFTACVLKASCNVMGHSRVNDCVDSYKTNAETHGLAAVYNKIYRCTAGAKDCAAVKACFGARGTCDAKYSASCQDGKAVFCDLIDHESYTFDCTAAGLQCQVDTTASFSATCTKGASAPAAEESLPTAVDCDDGSCSDTGESCTSDAWDRCVGDNVQACLTGSWVQFDCKGLGLSACFTSSNGIGSCGQSG